LSLCGIVLGYYKNVLGLAEFQEFVLVEIRLLSTCNFLRTKGIRIDELRTAHKLEKFFDGISKSVIFFTLVIFPCTFWNIFISHQLSD
jgi:hypothetical protein